jgi:hypothetical protein
LVLQATEELNAQKERASSNDEVDWVDKQLADLQDFAARYHTNLQEILDSKEEAEEAMDINKH